VVCLVDSITQTRCESDSPVSPALNAAEELDCVVAWVLAEVVARRLGELFVKKPRTAETLRSLNASASARKKRPIVSCLFLTNRDASISCLAASCHRCGGLGTGFWLRDTTASLSTAWPPFGPPFADGFASSDHFLSRKQWLSERVPFGCGWTQKCLTCRCHPRRMKPRVDNR